VSDRPLSNIKVSRQAAKRLRRRRNRLARRLLDEAFNDYLQQSEPRDLSSLSSSLRVPSPPPPPPPQLFNSPNQVPSPLRSPTPPLIEPDSPHSASTIRLRPDTPPTTPSISPPSYSPVHLPEDSPRPTSPANSTTSSVEFVDEILIPPPRPRHYYNYDPHQSIDTLIHQFPQRTVPLPPGSYSIGPDNFDLAEIRHVIGQYPDTIIPIFLPTSPFPYEVPIRFFYNFFPPSTVILKELE